MSDKLKQQSIFDLIQSAYTANILFSLTQAGVFDRLLGKPATSVELAAALGLEQALLHDLLLCAHSLGFLRMEEERFRLAKIALPLTGKGGSWQRDYLLVWGAQLNPAFARLGDQLATGDNAFAAAHGARIWDFYARDSGQNDVFVRFMASVTRQVHMPVLAAEIDLEGASRVLDVAGGTASLVCALAARHAALRADVYDQPSNQVPAQARIGDAALGERCTFIGGNIFRSVPAGYPLYTIKHVLHDWDDDNAASILQNIAAAMDGGARLLIIEGILDRPADQLGSDASYLHTRNIEQRLWTPGRVRTRAAFELLCERAGLRIDKVAYSSIFDVAYLSCKRR